MGQHPEERQALHGSSKPAVLLVDDDAINLVVLRQLLKRAGFDVVTASNGVEALQELEQKPFQLVMADINMPDMNGVELTRRIRTGMPDPICSVPMIAITAYNDPDEDAKYREAGFCEVVHKPIPFARLREVVSSVLQRGSSDTG